MLFSYIPTKLQLWRSPESLLHGKDMADLRIPTELSNRGFCEYSGHYSDWVMISNGDPLIDLHFSSWGLTTKNLWEDVGSFDVTKNQGFDVESGIWY